jgi:phospholipase A-2-activating protein
MASYRLINEQYAHAGPIRFITFKKIFIIYNYKLFINFVNRCVSMGPLGETVSGSQADAPSVRRWMIKDRSVFEEIGEQLFHDHWITAITCLSPGIHQVFPEGCIITGCMDNKIRLFDPVGNPLLEITGHNKGVISFSWTNTGNLISGSWDGTARIWEFQLSSLSNSITSNCLYILGPHENGVHVLGMKDGRIITTSTGESVNEKPANFQVMI